METFKDHPQLGRFTLRDEGRTLQYKHFETNLSSFLFRNNNCNRKDSENSGVNLFLQMNFSSIKVGDFSLMSVTFSGVGNIKSILVSSENLSVLPACPSPNHVQMRRKE